jgi:hypothetical protein
MVVELVDPTAELEAEAQEVAPPLSGVAGHVVSGIDNGKWNSPELIDGIIAVLVNDYGMVAGGHHSKLQYNIELDEDARRRIAKDATCAILAIGD